MRIETTRFGVLEVDENSIVRMPSGPLGFEDQTRFCLIQHRPDTSFRWLQSIGQPGLAFVVVDPADFFDDYEIEVTDPDAEQLELTNEQDALVLVILTVGKGSERVTANLAAPIVVNSKTLLGMQVVLQDERYSVSHPVATRITAHSPENTTAKAA